MKGYEDFLYALYKQYIYINIHFFSLDEFILNLIFFIVLQC